MSFPDQGTVGKANVGGAAATVDVTLGPAGENRTLRGVRDEAEIQIIMHTLHRTGWNRKRAAALLEISYRGLLYKIRRHRLTQTAPGERASTAAEQTNSLNTETSVQFPKAPTATPQLAVNHHSKDHGQTGPAAAIAVNR